MLDRNRILLVIHAFDGEIDGKTLLQKRVFFVQRIIEQKPPPDFRAHHFGPYSDTVSEEVGRLVASGLLEERTMSSGGFDSNGFPQRRYDYSLTEDGREAVEYLHKRYKAEAEKIRSAARKIRDAGDPGYADLSIAAKIQHIHDARKDPALSPETLCEYAREYHWEFTPEEARNGLAFLEKLASS